MLDHFFMSGALPANAIKGEYITLLVVASYLVACLGAFTGLTLAGRMMNEVSLREKQKLHWAGAISLGSGIWSMHFIGMLAYDMKMTHHYNPWLTLLSGIIAIAVAWFVLKIAQSGILSWKRLSSSSALLGSGIAAMHYIGMSAMQMDAELRYTPGLFALSIAIAVAASGAALWIILALGRHTEGRQMARRMTAALVMGIAICGMHYTGMAAAVIIPAADCRFDANQAFPLLGISIIAVTGLICMTSLMLSVANRMAVLAACGALFSLPIVAIVYQAVSGLNEDILFTKREQQGLAYHEGLTDLLLSLQKLRDLTNMAQHGDRTALYLIPTQKQEVTGWIEKADAVDRLYGETLKIHEDWLGVKKPFSDLLEEHTKFGHDQAEFEFSKHSKVIRGLMNFMETVADKSNLNTDPEPDSNIIADVLYNLTPEMTQTLGEMRGLGAGYLSSAAHSPELWTAEQQKKLRILYSQLKMLDDLIENRLHRSVRILPAAQRFVDYRAATIAPKTERFLQRYERMIFSGKTDWTAQELFNQSSEIIQDYDSLYDDMTGTFSGTLKHRQKGFAPKKNLVLLSSIIGLFGFIALFGFLFRSLTKTERAERKATEYIEHVQEAQWEALKAKAEAENAARAKSDFLANMSHELRTPMNGVLGMAHLLADTELSEEQKQYVSTINGSGENLLMLLNDILDFSKIEAGELTLETIAYNVKETIAGAIDLLRPQADKKGIELQMEYEPEVLGYIWGDPGRVRQIVINLAGNALKFTERGHVRVTLRMQEQANYLHISVEDTGMGISADQMDRIFDKFTQADASVTRKFGGTGLGLAITKQLVTLMGGHIDVESAEGKGSTFWFTIPCKAASEEDALASREIKSATCAVAAKRVPIEEARILLVEDYPVNQVFAQKLLRKFGACHIDMAENGVEALLKYRTGTYDMIFMDCQMPELDGYQTTTKIRLMEENTPLHTPIIAMTANAMMGDREKCLKSGMDDYLSKPLRAEHLKKILTAWFILDMDKATITKSPAAPAKQVDEAPVDMDQLRIFTDGDPEEEKALFTLFLEQAEAMIDILRQSTGNETHEDWKSAAHRFKGSSGNLGAMKLHHLCKRAETHFKDEENRKLEMLAAIQAETARVANFFHA